MDENGIGQHSADPLIAIFKRLQIRHERESHQSFDEGVPLSTNASEDRSGAFPKFGGTCQRFIVAGAYFHDPLANTGINAQIIADALMDFLNGRKSDFAGKQLRMLDDKFYGRLVIENQSGSRNSFYSLP